MRVWTAGEEGIESELGGGTGSGWPEGTGQRKKEGTQVCVLTFPSDLRLPCSLDVVPLGWCPEQVLRKGNRDPPFLVF